MHIRVFKYYRAGVNDVYMADSIYQSVSEKGISCSRDQLIGIEGLKTKIKVVTVGLSIRKSIAQCASTIMKILYQTVLPLACQC